MLSELVYIADWVVDEKLVTGLFEVSNVKVVGFSLEESVIINSFVVVLSSANKIVEVE